MCEPVACVVVAGVAGGVVATVGGGATDMRSVGGGTGAPVAACE